MLQMQSMKSLSLPGGYFKESGSLSLSREALDTAWNLVWDCQENRSHPVVPRED